jgi:hypothetical protein
MWIIKNKLRALLRIEGTQLSIPPEAELDLDRYGRAEMESLLPLAVAFEEGYIENVFKEAAPQIPAALHSEQLNRQSFDITSQLDEFKRSILDEIRRSSLPQGRGVDDSVLKALFGEHMGAVQEELKSSMLGMRGMMDGVVDGMKDGLTDLKKQLEQKLVAQRAAISSNPNLSDAEIRARLAFIEETERTLRTNFDRLGHVVEGEDVSSDVLGNADLLADI